MPKVSIIDQLRMFPIPKDLNPLEEHEVAFIEDGGYPPDLFQKIREQRAAKRSKPDIHEKTQKPGK